MGILDNLENAWDPGFEFESKAMPNPDSMGREQFWEDIGRPDPENISVNIFSETVSKELTKKDLYHNQILNAVLTNTGTVLRGAIPKDMLPYWEEFLNNVNSCAHDDDPMFKNEAFEKAGKKVIGILQFWGEFNLVSPKTSDHYRNKDFYIRELTDIYQGELTDINSVFSVTDWDKSSTRHRDNADVLNLQCLGKTRWRTSEAYDSSPTEFILEPGDVIFIPKELWHEVTAIGPRANLIFGFEANKPGSRETIVD